VLEASGLSDPIAIAELFRHEKLRDRIFLAHVWCIVDAVNYLKVIQMAERLKRQIMIADTLIINKIDSGAGNLSDIHESLSELNPDAVRMESTYCHILFNGLQNLLKGFPLALTREKQHNQIKPYGRAPVNTVTLKTTYRIGRPRLDLFLRDVEQKVIRMKGFVNLEEGETLRIQSVFGETHADHIHHYTGPTEMIGIGFNITASDFGKKFHYYRKS